MGVTESAGARDEIRAAAEQMVWVEPQELTVLWEAPTRSTVAAIFFGRRDQLRRASVMPLSNGAGDRLIGLEDAGGSRYFLLHRDDGYLAEDLYVLLITPVNRGAA